MDASFTPEQDELRAQARAFLEASPAPTWAELAELGWTGVSIPEELGGAGLGFVEQAVLHEELGRALTPGPFFSTVAVALPGLPPEEQARVAAGETSWVLALGPLVPDLDTVEHIAVVGGDGIYELVGAAREVLDTSDESRPLGVIAGGEVARRLASTEPLPTIRQRSLAALALEACGAGRRAFELAVEYVGQREQFGRPVGSYQAVAHPLATSYTELELARSLTL
jgi:alkylation response protein AidB-like acyl-CoA dehydrogenase